jgi:hypothetical protein
MHSDLRIQIRELSYAFQARLISYLIARHLPVKSKLNPDQLRSRETAFLSLRFCQPASPLGVGSEQLSRSGETLPGQIVVARSLSNSKMTSSLGHPISKSIQIYISSKSILPASQSLPLQVVDSVFSTLKTWYVTLLTMKILSISYPAQS